MLEGFELGEVLLDRFGHDEDRRLGIVKLHEAAVFEPVDDGAGEEVDVHAFLQRRD